MHVPEGAAMFIDCAPGVAACPTNGALVALGSASSAGIGGHLYESSGVSRFQVDMSQHVAGAQHTSTEELGSAAVMLEPVASLPYTAAS